MQLSSPVAASPSPPSLQVAPPASSRPGWVRLLPDRVRATWLIVLVSLLGGLFLVAVPYEFAVTGLPPHNPNGRPWGGLILAASIMLWLANFYPRRLGILDPLGRAILVLELVTVAMTSWLTRSVWPLLPVYLLLAVCLVVEGLPRFRQRGFLSLWVGGFIVLLGLTSLFAPEYLFWDYPQVTALFRWPLIVVGIPAGLGVVLEVWRRGAGWRVALFGLLGLLYLGLAVALGVDAKLRLITFLIAALFCFLAAWSPWIPVLGGLRLRLMQSFLVAGVLPMLLLSMLAPLAIERSLAARAREDMEHVAQSVAASIAQQAAARETLDLGALMLPLPPDPDARIRVIDTRTGATLQTYVLPAVPSVGSGVDQTAAFQDPNQSISADAPIANTPWQVVAEESAARVYAPLSWMIRALLAGLVMAGALALLLAHVLSDAVIRRIDDLRHTALALAAGDLSQRSGVGGKDELTDLGQAFNQMADQIEVDQAELAALNAQLQRAVDNRDTFMSTASHELKTPLTPIKGYAQGLLRQLQRGDGRLDRYQVESALRAIDQQADRLNTLVDELLDVARLRGGHFFLSRTPTDLVSLTIDTVDRVRQSQPEGEHLFTVETPPHPVAGEWDRARLEQVITNLLTNAVRYSPRGNEIQVRVEADGTTAHLSVRDQGIGIAADDLPHLFDAYYRAPDALAQHGGLGLGLFITRAIVTAHGGHITVESDGLGAGSLFRVALPLAPVAPTLPDA